MFAEGRSRRTADRKNGGPRYLLWNRRFHPFNVHTEEKRREKLNYMHNSPVKRGLVSSPGDWPWSSWRYYFLHDASAVRMDRLD
jgi:putative transposase